MKPGEMLLDVWKYILEYALCASSFQNCAKELFITFLGDISHSYSPDLETKNL